MRMQAILMAMLSSLVSLQVSSASSLEPRPQLNTLEKPSEVGQRTVPQPAQPESQQPPPDAVGKVPKELKKAAREKETEKLLRKGHRR